MRSPSKVAQEVSPEVAYNARLRKTKNSLVLLLISEFDLILVDVAIKWSLFLRIIFDRNLTLPAFLCYILYSYICLKYSPLWRLVKWLDTFSSEK